MNLYIHTYIQGDLIREMKSQGKPQLEIQEAVQELKRRKKILETKVCG